MCQDNLTVAHEQTTKSDQQQQQLRHDLVAVNEQLEGLRHHLERAIGQNEELESTIQELNSQNNLLETKLFETMSLIDLRNQTVIEYEQQMDRIKLELIQKHKESLDKQCHIDELEQLVIEKTAEAAQLTETLETGLVKSHHREKYAEDNASKALNDIKILQREVREHRRTHPCSAIDRLVRQLRHLSEKLANYEHTNAVLNEQHQLLTSELKGQHEESQQIQKSLNKQVGRSA